jgi:hypothetical protein
MKNDPVPDIYDYLTWLEQSPETITHALDAIAVYDLDGHVVYGNTAARVLRLSSRAKSRGRHNHHDRGDGSTSSP